jgi:hypothetical protein
VVLLTMHIDKYRQVTETSDYSKAIGVEDVKEY